MQKTFTTIFLLLHISIFYYNCVLYFYEFTRCRQHTTSTWLDRSGLMSVIWNLSRLILYVPKYLRLFVETYLLILYQKYLDTFCYPYRSLNLVCPRKKFNFFIRFYYYSDSNIKVKQSFLPVLLPTKSAPYVAYQHLLAHKSILLLYVRELHSASCSALLQRTALLFLLCGRNQEL